jgi:hypothetical protein
MISVKTLTSARDTGTEINRLVRDHSTDLWDYELGGRPLPTLSLPVYYDLVRRLPYKKDATGIEVVTRPAYILGAPWAGWDCKKKAILIASYLRERDIPYRLVAVSRRPDGHIHHCVVQALIDDQWRTLDATYLHNSIGDTDEQTWTHAESLSGNCATSSPVVVSISGDNVNEFNAGRTRVGLLPPPMMGQVAEPVAGVIVAIVGAAITAAAGITAAIIGAVSSKRSQERAFAQQLAITRLIERQQADQIDAAQIDAEENRAWLEKYGLPSLLAAGLFVFS